MMIKGHTINPGYYEGEAIVIRTPFSFVGELDPVTGKIPSPSHELFGRSIAGKVLVCPTGKGSSGAPMTAWKAVKAGTGPGAIVCIMAEPIIASAAITADIPMMDRIETELFEKIKTGDYLKVDATKGIIEICDQK
ncbi:MAG: DUF126 domain-containing protein [Deltaproteobacteria bacterium]|nr:DUF126 domain-containing protein [Deltaproteobacteria bacterium]